MHGVAGEVKGDAKPRIGGGVYRLLQSLQDILGETCDVET